MSLVVLKRKSQIRNSKISSERFSKNGFSLNNPRRVESKSGRGRVQTQTPMKGTDYRGHGGCCGTFKINPVKSQYVNDDVFERDFTLSDKVNTGISVKNHHGSIATRYKWLNGTYPNYVVKDTRQLEYNVYISNLAAQNAASSLGRDANVCVDSDLNCPKLKPNITKRVDILSYSEYLKTKFMNKHCLPPKNDKLPVPRPVTAHCGVGCNNGDMLNVDYNYQRGNCQ